MEERMQRREGKSVRLDVPFHTNPGNDCGPVVLQMALGFFGEAHTYEELSKLAMSDTSGATMSIGLAKAAAELGFPTEFYSTSLGFNPAHFEHEFYQKVSDGAQAMQEKIRVLQQECVRLGVRMEERSLSQEEVLDKLSSDCLIVSLFNWRSIVNREGYHGHFMVIVGYDERHVYLHQPGPKDPEPFFRIDRQIFDLARRAPGTDEDIIFIHRKKQRGS